MASKKRVAYIPTVDGWPARFDGYQLCVGGGRGFKLQPVDNLQTVRKQIKASIKNRRSDGFKADQSDYGYALIEMP